MNPWLAWLKDTAQRATRTFVQTLVASGVLDSLDGLSHLPMDFKIAGLAAAASVAHSILDNVQLTGSSTADIEVNLSTSAMGVEPKQGA